MTPEEFTAYMSTFALYYVFIGLGVLLAAFVQAIKKNSAVVYGN